MSDRGDRLSDIGREKVNWRRLLITLAVGGVLTIICFLFGWWWVATAFLLLTLLIMCTSFPPDLAPSLFTLLAFFAIAWISGSWLNGRLAPEEGALEGWRALIPVLAGVTLGIVIPAAFWLVVLFVSTKWILAVSESFGVSGWNALKLVASQVFDTSQNYWIVENGQVAVESPRGILSKAGGPGLLVVRPGNAVVLERGGKTTRIVGPGTHRLKRFEIIKRPPDKKGIVDLSPQYVSGDAEDVMTSDGIPLKIEIGHLWQIEPKEVTDRRPGSQFAGGEATTPIVGAPEYPVYEAIIRKAVFRTTGWGWKVMFPVGPISVLRDVVGTYTVEKIFSVDDSGSAAPDPRVIRRIEEAVNARFDASWAGITFGELDIRTIEPPEDVRRQLLERWRAPLEGQVTIQRARAQGEARIEQAKAEREALLELSEGRARSIERLEGVRLEARARMVRVLQELIHVLPEGDQDRVMTGFISVFEQLTSHVGQDETVAMRYIETMQAIIASDGPKSFVIMPPNASPGFLPSRSPAMLQPTTESTEKKE